MELHSMEFIQNERSPNNGILFNGLLLPRLLNNPFASCFLINLDFLLPHIAHFDNIIILPLLVFDTTGLMFPVFFCPLDNKIALFYT